MAVSSAYFTTELFWCQGVQLQCEYECVVWDISSSCGDVDIATNLNHACGHQQFLMGHSLVWSCESSSALQGNVNLSYPQERNSKLVLTLLCACYPQVAKILNNTNTSVKCLNVEEKDWWHHLVAISFVWLFSFIKTSKGWGQKLDFPSQNSINKVTAPTECFFKEFHRGEIITLSLQLLFQAVKQFLTATMWRC